GTSLRGLYIRGPVISTVRPAWLRLGALCRRRFCSRLIRNCGKGYGAGVNRGESAMTHDSHDHCGEIASQRLRYFTGRYMTARDFRDEQAYHRSHRYLHNRMLHGWGVVCGLHVHPHKDPECAKDHVRVDCGFAMDCCGRELPLEHAEVPPPIDWKKRPEVKEEDRERRYYPLLCLEYCESEIERVPVLYSEHKCDPQ